MSTQTRRTADNTGYLPLFVFALFFFFGGTTSLNDILIPKLKQLFTLSYGEVMTVQSAFFAAYLIVSLPAAAVVRRIGYMRAAVLGLMMMTAGCVLFVPASRSALFPMFLLALFVVAAGITIVQVVSNPLISKLGPAATVHSRLTFAQAFNSLGTMIFPYIGSVLILGAISTVNPTHVIERTYLALAAILFTLAMLVYAYRNHLRESHCDGSGWREMASLLGLRRFAFGAACIFLYVGAEVAIGSLIVNYLMQSDVLGLGQKAAGEHVPFYWGGAMVGRFIGAYLLRVISPGKVLAAAATGVLTLLFISSHTTGALSGWSLLAIGLCNSIMFPTIFSLASEGLGPRAASASGLIGVAIVGGAIVPPLTGHVADLIGLKAALLVPAICYAGILSYGIYARRPAATTAAVPAAT
ncbi:MAG TPA: sugar MFS transporter [Steroidobacteraceae bacterium]|jgi:MFS transporter, FHS family, L-fucose permease|nr:sugar MFS transporter [Steroidobacteraceae bacterium]